MMHLNFDNLVDLILNEAPMSSFIRRPTSQAYRNNVANHARQMQQQAQQQQQNTPSMATRLGRATAAATPGVKSGLSQLKQGVGSVVGAAAQNIGSAAKTAGKFSAGAAIAAGKAALDSPVKTARNFFLGNNPTGMVKQGVSNAYNAMKDMNKPDKDIEEFDINDVKALLAGGQQQQKPGQTSATAVTPGTTSSGTIQGAGQVTQGQVISGGLPGTAPAGTSTTATTTPTTQSTTRQTPSSSTASGTDPKKGVVFTIKDDHGRMYNYEIQDVKNNIVAAKRIYSK